MYDLKDGNPRKLSYYNTVDTALIDNIQQDLNDEKITTEDAFWKYQQLAFEGIQYPDNKTEQAIWKKLTRVQKIVLVMNIFIGQTNNGGVWQFFFNRPDYAIAVAEAFHELDSFSRYRREYEKPLNDFAAMSSTGVYQELMEQIYSLKDGEDAKRWKLFKDGQEHIPSHEAFETFFYDQKNKSILYGSLIRYIHQHLSKLLKIELPEGEEAAKPISKKEAIPHFTSYLESIYHEVPTEVKIYYTGRVTMNNQAAQLFLMQYKLPSGRESIGITGYFTYDFEEIDQTEINGMYRQYHKQELVNLYHGWYRAEKILLQNPKAREVNAKDWAKTLRRLQGKSQTQIPVNIVFREGFLVGEEQWYLYEGDLYYNRKNKPFPEDLDNVDIEKFGGEKGLLFSTSVAHLPSFGGRMKKNTAVKAKYRIYDIIGSKHKLLKDNAWGF